MINRNKVDLRRKENKKTRKEALEEMRKEVIEIEQEDNAITKCESEKGGKQNGNTK